MSRDVGERALFEALPEVLSVLAALVTQLGDVWFAFVLFGLLYWFGTSLPAPFSIDRNRGGFLVALGLGSIAVTTMLKEWFRLPRPPGAGEAAGIELLPVALQPVYTSIGTAAGFGFPSGHAVGAVVVYGGLALLVDSRRGYAAAAAIVPTVALSRLVLGVHYLVDTLVGLAVGGLYLAVVYLACDRGSNPSRALTIALLVALAGAVVGGYTFDTMAVLGGTLGARIAWGALGDAVVHEATTRVGGAVATAFGSACGALFGIIYALDPVPYAAFLGMVVVLTGVVAAPLVGETAARRV
jgi:membrane-associated phospholipid phosphatase